MQSARALFGPVAISTFRLVDRLRPTQHRFILILSHMRSGSSLLLHLLMTSRDIAGCGERNTVYRDHNDLVKLAIKSNFGQRGKCWASCAVDQINHTHFLPSERLLLHPSVFPIVLFRQPLAAVSSMVDVFSPIYEFELDDAIKHYRERVATLARYSKLLRSEGRLLALTYNDLVDDTQQSLIRLKNYIGLRTPLTENYSTYDFTGTRGDPSTRIQSGRILPERTDHGIEIDSVVLQELNDLYKQCAQATET